MLTGPLRHQVDAVWNAFWTGGLSNPLTVIEQFTYLLFLRGLDERQTKLEKRAHLLEEDVAEPVFAKAEQHLR